jgi:hypothetical protein
MSIILRVYQMAHITRKTSSPVYSKSFATPDLQNKATEKSKLHSITTTASKICHHLRCPVEGFLKYLEAPTSFNLHPKSPAIRTFSKSSKKMNKGESATLNPSTIVTKIRIAEITRSEM